MPILRALNDERVKMEILVMPGKSCRVFGNFPESPWPAALNLLKSHFQALGFAVDLHSEGITSRLPTIRKLAV